MIYVEGELIDRKNVFEVLSKNIYRDTKFIYIENFSVIQVGV